MREIESAGGIPFTAIINNTNLGRLTDEAVVRIGIERAERLSKLCGLPILCTAVEKSLAETLGIEGIMPIELQKKYYDII